MIDTHCHLGDPGFAEDLEQVVERARRAGVSACLCVLSLGNSEERAAAERLRSLWPSARFAIGLHPHEAHLFAGRVGELLPALDAAAASLPGLCALGEIGLDYHYDFSPRPLQREVFGLQIRQSLVWDRPIVIHTREADEDTLAILDAEGEGRARGVFHCFSGTEALAAAALERGFYLSFSGILAFPKAEALRRIAAAVPRERLLLETDCPYLAPPPHRGKRNEPAFVLKTAEVLARAQGLDLKELEAITTGNAARVFGLDAS